MTESRQQAPRTHPTHQAREDAEVRRVASLSEPVRRLLYRHVAAQPDAVSREEVAAGAQVPHHVAKFHLDRLEDDGLLEVEYRRPAGRSGPGAGRPAKYYRRAPGDLAVSLPERRYDLAGRLMAEAITNSDASGRPVGESLRDAARTIGQELGEQAGPPPSTDPLGVVAGVLEENGYEPARAGGCLTLINCPFHRLAADYTELVCGMNLDLVTGIVEQVDRHALAAHLDPAADRCCVTVSALDPEVDR